MARQVEWYGGLKAFIINKNCVEECLITYKIAFNIRGFMCKNSCWRRFSAFEIMFTFKCISLPKF